MKLFSYEIDNLYYQLMKQILIKSKQQSGQILILGIVIMAILMTLSTSLWGYTILQVKSSRQSVTQSQALQIAEAGIDKAIYELNSDSSFSGESSISLGGGEFTTSVSSIDSNNKQITATGSVPNSSNPKSQVTVKINVSIDLNSVAFNFGVQVGAGGLQMDNNSKIIGNVYSNGDITGGNGTITGDATVAGGGSATADQQCTVNNANFAFNQSDRKDVAQKFTPSVSGPLTKVSAYIKKNGSPGDITVRIVTNNSNNPSKTQVGGSGTISSSTVTTSYGWADASFTTTPTLIAGNAYWIILDTSNSSTNYYTWANDNSDSSCSGTGNYSDDWNKNPNPTWTLANSDFNVRTYMGGVPTKLTNVTVNGNVRANAIQSCTVGLDAYYASTNTCTVAGSTHSGTADSSQQSMPISQAQIDEWKSAAQSGGNITGPYTVSGNVTMGPTKITGDLTINGNLTMTGPIWVEGNITMGNNSSARVDASLGNAGTVLLADNPSNQSGSGLININNNVTIAGNNFAGSYAMVITTKSGTAMNISNNAAGAIYYAANGTIEVANNAGGNQITGYQIHLNNNAVITYSTGLQSATFANGPGGSWAKVDGSYYIVQ